MWSIEFVALSLTGLANGASVAELGVNYNQFLGQIERGDIDRTRAKLVRGFVDYYQFRQGKLSLQSDSGLRKLDALHKAGYKVILNIKFDLQKRDFPTTTGGIAAELAYLDPLVARVYPLADVLVAGNEPFIESKKDQRDQRLVNFYKAIAMRVNSYRVRQSRKIPIYIGAFDNLWKPAWQTSAANGLLQFANDTSWVAGVDLHIHHTEFSDIDGALEYASQRTRENQSIIATEFSMKNQWKLHNRDPIPAILSTQYSRPKSWKVYQYLNFAIHNPVTRQEWVDFLKNSAWFETRKDYLTVAWRKFTGYPKFSMATYGLYQNAPAEFKANTDPWIINPLLVNTTVVKDSRGKFQPNYTFLEEFRYLRQVPGRN